MKEPTNEEVTMELATFTNENGNPVVMDVGGARASVHEYVFGTQAHRLDDDARVDVYLECDGFGDTRTGAARAEMLAYMEHGWDWSHVRDSSPEALHRALGMVLARQRTPEFAGIA